MNAQRKRFVLFDCAGLDAETIRTLRLLIVAVMGGVIWRNITTGVAITTYLKELGASDFLYGVLVALPPLANSFQFAASYLLERWLPRQKTFIVTGFIQRLSWIPFALVPLIIPMQAAVLRLWATGLLLLVSAAMQPFMDVSFYSICSDVVPTAIRGRYFAVRSRISIAAGLVIGLIVGWLLDALPPFANYVCVFLIAGVFGGFDVFCFLFMKIPPMKKTDGGKKLGAMFVQVFRDANYMRLCLFGAVFYFGVYCSSSFFMVYMREVLKLTNMQMVLISQITVNVFAILSVGGWGRAYDRFGNRPILILNTFLGAMVPFLWVFAGSGTIVMAILAQIVSGLQWAAFEVGSQNLFMGQASKENSTMYFAVYFIGTQLIGMALGSSVGGWLLDNPLRALENAGFSLLGQPVSRYAMLFLISTLIRLTGVMLLPAVQEKNSASLPDALRAMGHDAAAAVSKRFKRRI